MERLPPRIQRTRPPNGSGHVFLFLAQLVAAAVVVQAQHPLNMGSRLELFVDDYLIQRLDGARLKLHEPKSAGVALRFDRSWEGEFSGFPKIVEDGDSYHMYYRALLPWKKGEALVESICHAISRDGIHWEKPVAGLIELLGSKRNNAVFKGSGFAPFLDTRPGVPRSERLKALKGPPRLDVDVGVLAYASSDGVHWNRLQEKAVYAGDRLGSVFWSPDEGQYIQYVRSSDEGGDQLIRSISRATSPNFLEWSEFESLDFGCRPPTWEEQLYTVWVTPYYRAPHLYLALAARFLPGKRALTDEQCQALGRHPLGGGCENISDMVLLTTRAAQSSRISRTYRQGFLRPGLEKSSWTSRTNYPVQGILPTGKGEISIYVQRDYGFKSNRLERLVLRTDGFASVRAPYAGGELLTRTLNFSGQELVVNYATSAAGSIQVEIQDASGAPLNGFGLEDCPQLIGDEIERVVRWKQGNDLSELQGKPIQLRFVMRDSDLYSLKFR